MTSCATTSPTGRQRFSAAPVCQDWALSPIPEHISNNLFISKILQTTTQTMIQ
jgi:hypothetical protein